MTNSFRYKIAGVSLSLETTMPTSPLDKIEGFSLFKNDNLSATPHLVFSVAGRLDQMREAMEYTELHKPLHEFDFDDEIIKCSFYSDGSRYLFKMVPEQGTPFLFVCDNKINDNDSLRIVSNWEETLHSSMLRFGTWMAFAIAVAPKKAFPIHSSVIVYDDRAILFLGESGTGKSTHTRLWRQNIPGSFLLNDDSPIISAANGKIFVFGSPWSGKTPCYKDAYYPVAAIVRLSQAPANHITELGKIAAFGALYPSAPPAFAYDEPLSDLICASVSDIIERIPIFSLECLPDAAAAIMVKERIELYNKTK